MIVVDTNLILHLTIAGERTAQVEQVRSRDGVWAAPLLWRSEYRNVLSLYMRTGKMGLETALELAADAEARMEGREYSLDASAVLRLAADSSCTAYDCEFVALARQLGVKLVTTDKQVLAAFPETAVSLDSF